MARRKIALDTNEVERLAGLGLTDAEIALSFGVSVDTIGRRKQDSADFAEAIKRGRMRAKGEVANAIFERARVGDMTAAIWFEKTRSGFTDKVQQEHTGEIIIRVRYEDQGNANA